MAWGPSIRVGRVSGRRSSGATGMATTPTPSAMLRPRRNWTRGVAAQHASLSRWRSPVRIRSGPPSLRISLRPVRPPGRGVLLPGGRCAGTGRRPIAATSVTLRPVKGRPFPVVLGLLLVALVTVLAVGQLGLVGGSSNAQLGAVDRPRPRAPSRLARGVPSSVRPDRDSGSRRRRRARTPATPGPIADVPIVPVTNFRAAPTSTSARPSSRTSWRARARRYTALELVAGEADAILAALEGRAAGRRDAPRARRMTKPPSPPTSPRTASGSPSCGPTRSGRRSGRCPGATRRSSASVASRPWRTGR